MSVPSINTLNIQLLLYLYPLTIINSIAAAGICLARSYFIYQHWFYDIGYIGFITFIKSITI
jgi:hypothetical protein